MLSLHIHDLAPSFFDRVSLPRPRDAASGRLCRHRDVRQGLDGALNLLTDNPAGRVLRVDP